MNRPLPRTPAQWLKEIKLAIADAREAEPFAPLVGTEITDANLFHLAPLVCLKFRGRKLKGREADRVIKVALANYVANSDPAYCEDHLQEGWDCDACGEEIGVIGLSARSEPAYIEDCP